MHTTFYLLKQGVKTYMLTLNFQVETKMTGSRIWDEITCES